MSTKLSSYMEDRLHTRAESSMIVLKHLFKNMPFDEKIELSDGLKGVIKPFFRPRPNQLGRPHAGIDVEIFENGEYRGHLEFLLTLSGSQGYYLGPPFSTFERTQADKC